MTKEKEFNNNEHELKAALGMMLFTWDESSKRLVDHLTNPTKETAKHYGEMMTKLFEVAALARVVYHRCSK